MTGNLDDLARRFGIASEYTGLDGSTHIVPEGTKRAILGAMGVDASDSSAAPGRKADTGTPHISAVPRCHLPDWLENGRSWGIALQVYALRSDRNWGIGDFRDLADFASTAAAAGADFVGTNPLHALFLSEPSRRSPFFPSNRRFLNPLYIAVDEIPGYEPSDAELRSATLLREAELVDYEAVTRLKLATLKRLWPLWLNADVPKNYSQQAFADFCSKGGESLYLHCLFDALSLELSQQGHGGGWKTWPEEYQAPTASGSQRFAASHQVDVEFMLWLQWLAHVQLEKAHRVALGAGMRIGLYLDFAVGEAPDGSAAWSDPILTMRGVDVGAPPDYFSTTGQNWGLAPLSPAALVEQDLAPYRELISATMAYGGAMRIDHAMGIQQMFLVPEGQPASEGTYIHYPLERMVQTLAAASHDHQSLLIGEDLGNVPVGFRDVMEQAAILSYRILYFEQRDGSFIAAEDYPQNAMACLSTHDLPTIEGWWRGEDVELRHEHGLIEADAAEQQLKQREEERRSLLSVLRASKLIFPEEAEALEEAAAHHAPLPASLVDAVHRFLARTPSRLLAVRLEDLAGERLPVNLPGTVDAYPNWQRKLELDLEEIKSASAFVSITQMLSNERPRSS
ncbi:4-alpha-glucanotransferase [Devosia sp. RR2S18]|uniref:4-alpha-glucanotransferase n=1 Tax=Devosia rhizosphaerae TaxID=3049774 RepID=UPI00254053E2|nr:4-alpha-glucanotransferase [Devosia sp. RR2S18]WIJ23512.1 4-alpha-glucanotransferase [Devosia sp. RR2S18]